MTTHVRSYIFQSLSKYIKCFSLKNIQSIHQTFICLSRCCYGCGSHGDEDRETDHSKAHKHSRGSDRVYT